MQKVTEVLEKIPSQKDYKGKNPQLCYLKIWIEIS